MAAGEGRVRGFGEAFEGLLGRISGRGAGRRMEIRVLALILPRIPGLGDLQKPRCPEFHDL